MAILTEKCIRPFLLGAEKVGTKVCFMQFPEFIDDSQKAVQEELLAARIEACIIKVSHLIEMHAGACNLNPQVSTALLLSGKYDYNGLINSLIRNINIDNLSMAVNKLVYTEMEEYFDVSISIQEEFVISTQKLLPPLYIKQVLQEYINTLRVTKVMGQAVNKVCHQGMAKMNLPWAAKKMTDKIELGSVLMSFFDCHPEKQREKTHQQMSSCINGIITNMKFQIKKQFDEEIVQRFYQLYDELEEEMDETLEKRLYV